MKKITLFTTLLIVFALVACFGSNVANAQQKPKLKFGLSIYVGWMPWYYAAETNDILKKWGDAYGVDIEAVLMGYLPSLTAFGSKEVDAVVTTNMEMLDMPAASGIDCRVIVTGDFSNGNDAVLTRGLSSIEGQDVYLAENSVSHYLAVRYLERNGKKESDIRIINTSDENIGPAFIVDKSQKVVVTWNPMVMQIAQVPGVKTVFTSAQIPGEILDLLVVRGEILDKYPGFGKALTGAWYEIMNLMQQRGAGADNAMKFMAERSGATLTEFKSQLTTTAMFYTPQSAVEYTKGDEIKKNMDFVRQFCFQHGLLGDGAKSADIFGISYPDGSVQGNKKKIRVRFDVSYMQMAADGKLKR